MLAGDDDREKSALALALGEMVEEGLRAFNVERLYGGDTTAAAIVEAAETLPMMAPRRVVVVLQAERLMKTRRRSGDGADDDDGGGGGDLEPLVAYLQKPSPSTTLAFVVAAADPLDQKAGHALSPLPLTLRVTKALAKVAVVVRCDALEGETNPVAWVVARVKQAGREIDRRAAAQLAELAGNDHARLRADVERVLLYAGDEPAITSAHVAEVAGGSELQEEWGLARALERGDAAGALRELKLQLDAGRSPFLILGQIGYVVRTPPPRGRYPAGRVPAAVESLFKADQTMKSSGDARVLLERLVVELCG